MGKEDATIANIKENYRRMEREIVNQLYFQAPHGGAIGQYREKIWGEMFRNIVPRKFVIEQSVFVIDSNGYVSREVDLVIFDEMYTPYVFKYGSLTFIPIEAVAVVIECKSKSVKDDVLENWEKSICRLKTSPRSYVRTQQKVFSEAGAVPTQTATRPLRILCCLKDEGKKALEKRGELFDVVIQAIQEENNGEYLKIIWGEKDRTLHDWYMSLNHADKEKDMRHWEAEKTDNIKTQTLKQYEIDYQNRKLSLMTFNFQLNQILMLINNPMLFPHIAYAEMFKRDGKTGE